MKDAGDKRPSLHRGRRAPARSWERRALPEFSRPTWPGECREETGLGAPRGWAALPTGHRPWVWDPGWTSAGPWEAGGQSGEGAATELPT